MKVNAKFEFPDAHLRQINVAQGGRGRKATRSDVRIWLYQLVAKTLDGLPYAPARTRKKQAAVVDPVHADNIICANCSQPFVAHAGMGQSCPLSKSARPRGKFKSAAA